MNGEIEKMGDGLDGIPESLRRQIRGYELALCERETALLFALAFTSVICSFFLLFVSDRLWDTIPLIRTLIFVAGTVSAAFLVAFWSRHWIFKRRGNRILAKEMQRNHPELGDRLLGAIELAEGKRDSEGVSEELVAAAIAKAASKAEEVNFVEDLDRKNPVYVGLATLILLSVAVFCWNAYPEACGNAFDRLLHPLSDIPRYTFTVLKPLPEKMIVPRNEPFELRCGIDLAKSKHRPDRLAFTVENVCSSSTSIGGDGGAVAEIPGMEKNALLRITAGDASAVVEIEPKSRPALKNLTVNIDYPEYTGLGVKNIRLKSSALEVLNGSKYSLNGEVVRKIKFAKLTSSNGSAIRLPVDGLKFSTPKAKIDSPEKISITWEDDFGMYPSSPCSVVVRPVLDRKPFVKCPGLAPFTAVLVNEVLKITVSAEDDLGVRSVDAEYAALSIDGKKTATAEKTRIPLARGGKGKRKLAAILPFSPKLMGIREKTLLTVWGVAGDFKPGRGVSRSTPHKIYVLSDEQHAQILSDRLKRVMADLEDMTRREEESLAKNERISKLPEEKIREKDATEKLKAQSEREVRENRELEELNAKTANLLKEALRNKKFPNESIRKWSEFLEKMKSLSANDMPKMLGHLNAAAQENGQRSSELSKAIERQKTMLDKLRKMMKKMDDSLNSLELETFVNRLKSQERIQRSISSELKKLTPRIIGLNPSAFMRSLKKEYDEILARQKTSREASHEIRGDLAAFFSRTRMRGYQDVVDDMDKSKLEERLAALSSALDENHTGTGVRTAESLSKDFKRWASMLSGSSKAKAGSRGGRGGGGGEIDMEMLMNILRMVQGEQNLREKTRALDRAGRKPPERAKKLQSLLEQQKSLEKLLAETVEKAKKCPKARKMLIKVGRTMRDVESLLSKPETGETTVAAETEVVERLAGAFSQACKGDAGKQPGAATMANLMRMMMKGKPGSTPSGNPGGGKSNAANERFEGTSFSGVTSPKTSNGASGEALGKIPQEFKSDIEAFLSRRRK